MVSRFFIKSIFLILLTLITVNCNIVRNNNICGHNNGRRLYLELGEQGILYAKNLSLIKNTQRLHQSGLRQYVTNDSYVQCTLELVTCPSCAIIITFKALNLPQSCSDVGIVAENPCRCDYVWISEPPYDDISGTSFCGLYSPVTYKSNTRTVSISLLYSDSYKHAFTLEYASERNRVYLRGPSNTSTKNENNTVGGILTSPFFPARYPRDLGLEYVITCPIESPLCRVRVLFSDFQLATVSVMEFYDWNGQRLDVSSGARFRPPIIVSSGPSLLIRFYANGGTGLGYKAFYSYIVGHLYDKATQPITDCGGYVENLGGAITMMDIVNQGVKTYDCVWLIRPPKNFLHMKTHMYLKVITFADMAGNTELVIRQGPTSALLPLDILKHPSNRVQPSRMREHVAPIGSGFHVSLRGTFAPNSRVAIAYAAFGYTDCFSSSDFLCHNHRCIPSQLNCDGFDHCGDSSDEPATCYRNWKMEPQDKKWHINKANYYFPKIDRYPDLKTATLVFVASSLGLIILISVLIILLYRMGARARQQRELQSRLQTISELLDGARIDEISVNDDPPVYEAPPGYDEVVKVGLESEIVRRKRRKNREPTPRSRSSPNQRSSRESSSILVNTVQRIPQSPPPPYVTPPGTMLRSHTTLSRHNILHISVPVSFRGNGLRRNWRRQSSFPGPDESTNIRSRTSIDAETLGVYLRKYNSTINAETSSLQPSSSLVWPSVNYGYRENLSVQDDARATDSHPEDSRCICEGACGCANQSYSSNQQQEQTSHPKTTIFKLLGSTGRLAPQGATIAARVALGSQVSESDTSIRRTSLISRESYFTQLSLTSRCCSPDGDNEFEIISDASTLSNTTSSTVSNTPADTPRIIAHTSADYKNSDRKLQHYSSCDLESLYESIRTLDTFLARRSNVASSQMRTQSSTVIFATPEHRGRRSSRSHPTSLFNCVRGWRSTDDAFAAS